MREHSQACCMGPSIGELRITCSGFSQLLAIDSRPPHRALSQCCGFPTHLLAVGGLQVRIVDDDAVGVLAFSSQEEKAQGAGNQRDFLGALRYGPYSLKSNPQVSEDFSGEKALLFAHVLVFFVVNSCPCSRGHIDHGPSACRCQGATSPVCAKLWVEWMRSREAGKITNVSVCPTCGLLQRDVGETVFENRLSQCPTLLVVSCIENMYFTPRSLALLTLDWVML